jgi:hypothetical protein
VKKQHGESGFVDCKETRDLFGRDVFLYKDKMAECNVGDWIRFTIFLNEKGMPQVTWFEHVEGGPSQGTKRPASDDILESMKRAAMGV